MEANTLNIIAVICCLVGIVGVFLPVLPGSALALIGLLVFKYSPDSRLSWISIIIVGVFVLIGSLLDYFAPIYTTKKMGGTKWGIWGAILGTIIGLFFPPFGFILGPFLGALAGELVYNVKEPKRALKAAFGSFIGFLITMGYELILCFIILSIIVYQWII